MFYAASESTSEFTLSEYSNRWVGKIIGVCGPTVRVEAMHIIESWSVNDTAKPSLNPRVRINKEANKYSFSVLNWLRDAINGLLNQSLLHLFWERG